MHASTDPHLQLLLLNVRSLPRHIDDVTSLIAALDQRFDCLVFTETWTPAEKQQLLSIPGYDGYFSRTGRNRASGVAVYVRSDLSSTQVEETAANADIVVANVTKGKCQFQLIGSYRSPSPSISDLDGYLESDLPRVARSLGPCCRFVLTDGNVNLAQRSRSAEDYLEAFAKEGFAWVETGSTREASGSTIDHIFVKGVDTRNVTVTVQPLGVGLDHSALMMSVPIDCSGSTMRQPALPTKMSPKALIREIKSRRWAEILSPIEDPNKMCNVICDELELCKNSATTPAEHYSPAKRTLLKPWMTKDLLSIIRYREVLFREWCKDKSNDALRLRFKELREFINEERIRLKSEFYRVSIAEADRKLAWSTVNEFMRGKKRSEALNPDALDSCKNFTEASDKVKAINSYFASVGKRTVESQGMVDSEEQLPVLDLSAITFRFSDPGVEELAAIISQLKPKKAAGYDGIGNGIAKTANEEFVVICMALTKAIFRTGIFPERLKTSKLTLVHKKGLKTDIDNFRPISLLCVIDKIIEKVIYRRLEALVEQNKLLGDHQFGFRRGRSTEGALLEVYEFIHKGLEENMKVAAVFLDLKKAFDTVHHGRLGKKLERMGLRGRALGVILTYLHSRRQRYTYNDDTSEVVMEPYGVPQGSVLGPLLFLLYINDLFDLRDSCRKVIYADDTCLLFKSGSTQDLHLVMETSLQTVNEWMLLNGLVLSPEKCKLMMFSLRGEVSWPDQLRVHVGHSPHSIGCHCKVIERATQVRYLGLFWDSNLTWRAHLHHVEAKLRQALVVLVNLRRCASREFRLCVYKALAESHLRYGLLCFGGSYPDRLRAVCSLQKTCLKMALGLPPRTASDIVFRSSSSLPVRHLYALSVLQHYLVRDADSGRQLIRDSLPTHDYPTSSKTEGHLNILPSTNQALRMTPTHQFIRLYNNVIPLNGRNPDQSVGLLKKAILTWIVSTDPEAIERDLVGRR